MTDGNHITVEWARVINGDGPWWVAHEHPERPADDWVLWSWSCDACIMHLAASDAVQGGDGYAEHVRGDVVVAQTTIANTLADARAWRAEHGMRNL